MSYYVKTKVELKLGQNADFYELLDKLVVFLRGHRWKMVLALQPLVGDLTEILHVWEVEKFEDIAAGLGAGSSDPEFAKHLARLPDLIHRETVQIMVKTPYSG